MGHCIEHTQCPECAKIGKDRHGNNLAVYDDGSFYCFACSYCKTKSEYNISTRTNRLLENILQLPKDISDHIPNRIKEKYLSIYGLSTEDIKKHHIIWSGFYERIYFPIFSEEGLIATLGRYCGNDTTKPKWYTQGNLKDILHIIGNSWSSTLVLTEDIISAIRVSHVGIKTMPIFGSHIPNITWLRLKKIVGAHKIIVWLDKDKQKESIKYTYAGRQLGLNVHTLITDEDPKGIEEKNIQKLLDKF